MALAQSTHQSQPAAFNQLHFHDLHHVHGDHVGRRRLALVAGATELLLDYVDRIVPCESRGLGGLGTRHSPRKPRHISFRGQYIPFLELLERVRLRKYTKNKTCLRTHHRTTEATCSKKKCIWNIKCCKSAIHPVPESTVGRPEHLAAIEECRCFLTESNKLPNRTIFYVAQRETLGDHSF